MVKENVILNVLTRMEQRDGVIQAERLVDDASSATHPLHTYFDWEDTEAAHKWRLHQARTLIIKVKVNIANTQVQAFHNVRVEINKVPVRGYFSAERVLSDKDMTAQILTRALDELDYWQTKYQTIKELAGVINQEKISHLKDGQT